MRAEPLGLRSGQSDSVLAVESKRPRLRARCCDVRPAAGVGRGDTILLLVLPLLAILLLRVILRELGMASVVESFLSLATQLSQGVHHQPPAGTPAKKPSLPPCASGQCPSIAGWRGKGGREGGRGGEARGAHVCFTFSSEKNLTRLLRREGRQNSATVN